MEQQKAIGEILRVMASSPGDVKPVLDVVAERAARLCEAPFARVMLVEGDVLRVGAEYSIDGRRHVSTVPLPLRRSSITGRAVLDRKLVHHGDVVPLLGSEYVDALNARRLGFRAVLAVPLIRSDSAYGAIFLFRREPRAFAPEQIALVETFARQAAFAIDHARLFNETKEALDQQTAISEILRVISSSPTDVQPMLSAVAERALRLCDAADATIFLVEGDKLRAAARFSSTRTAFEVGQFMPLTRGSVTGRAVFDGKVIHLEDLATAPEEEFPLGREIQRRVGHHAVLSAPLMREDRAIGAIALWRMEARRFTDRQIALVNTFADQAAIAIENVRLFNETKEALEQQRASAEVLAAISSSIADTTPVFDKILSSCERLFTGREAVIDLMGDDGLVHLGAYHGSRLDQVKEIYPHTMETTSATGTAITSRTVVHYASADELPRFAKQAFGVFGAEAAIGAPMMWEGKGIGAIWVIRDYAGPFSEKEVALLKTFADQAVIAIQNARLFREIEHKSRELQAASRHKSEFLANMSHELRTPLNAIIGFSEVLAERMFGEINEKQTEYIGDILQSGQHLLSLINDILDLSKIEAGRMELEFSDFNLPSTIEQTIILVRERAVRRGITLGRMIDERLASIRADERKLKQVLLNLLSNALKFTPEGGKIDVRAVVNDGVAEISVTDTGIGISPEDQEAVFEEFRQVGTASKKVEGTGLGLAISRKFIELHGGKIWVTSQVGTGSTFAFTLPLPRLTA